MGHGFLQIRTEKGQIFALLSRSFDRIHLRRLVHISRNYPSDLCPNPRKSVSSQKVATATRV